MVAVLDLLVKSSNDHLTMLERRSMMHVKRHPGGDEVTKLHAEEIAGLDPYTFMATIGKTGDPSGRVSTETVVARAGIAEASRVLDVGSGVATTAIEIARRYGAQMIAVDISPLMLERARANVTAAQVADKVTVEAGDSTRLRFRSTW
jgi:SAM-dependent methyltransferase